MMLWKLFRKMPAPNKLDRPIDKATQEGQLRRKGHTHRHTTVAPNLKAPSSPAAAASGSVLGWRGIRAGSEPAVLAQCQAVQPSSGLNRPTNVGIQQKQLHQCVVDASGRKSCQMVSRWLISTNERWSPAVRRI